MKLFLVNLGYAVNLAALGLVTYKLPPEGNATPIVLSLVMAALVMVFAWLALQIKKNEKFGKIGLRAGVVLPAVYALVFIWMGAQASGADGSSARVLLLLVLALISIQTFAQLMVMRPSKAVKAAMDAMETKEPEKARESTAAP